MINSFADIIDLWAAERPKAVAAAFAAAVGTTALNARAWRKADSIPPGWWRATIEAAHRAGHTEVTGDLLIRLAHHKRLAREAERKAAA